MVSSALTLPGNPGSNLNLVPEIKIRFVFQRNSVSRVVIPDLTLPGNPGSNLTLVTVIEIRFVFGDESKKEKKKLTPKWVVFGERRHAEPQREVVPSQLYPW